MTKTKTLSVPDKVFRFLTVEAGGIVADKLSGVVSSLTATNTTFAYGEPKYMRYTETGEFLDKTYKARFSGRVKMRKVLENGKVLNYMAKVEAELKFIGRGKNRKLTPVGTLTPVCGRGFCWSVE